MKRVKWLAGGVGLAAAAVAIKIMSRRDRSTAIQLAERRADPDPEALEAMMNGGARKISLDLEQLQGLNPEAYQPLVEYLTYIQVQRGDSSSLVFVRDRDIDTLADMLHQSKEEFMENFQQLGVMLSMN